MLGKLLKHEFKSTYKTFLMLYAGVIILSLLNAFTLDIETDNAFLVIVQALLMVGFVFGVLAVSVITVVLIVRRFYTHLLKDEGYLAHTIPVKPRNHVLAKWITGYVWMLVSGIVVIVSIMLLFIRTPYLKTFFKGAKEVFKIMGQNGNLTWMLFEVLMVMLVSVAFQIILLYASLAVGQLFSAHRILGAFLAYIVFSFCNQMVSAISVMGFNLETSREYELVVDGVTGTFEMPAAYDAVMITSVVISGILIAVYFFITQYMLKNKLNLE